MSVLGCELCGIFHARAGGGTRRTSTGKSSWTPGSTEGPSSEREQQRPHRAQRHLGVAGCCARRSPELWFPVSVFPALPAAGPGQQVCGAEKLLRNCAAQLCTSVRRRPASRLRTAPSAMCLAGPTLLGGGPRLRPRWSLIPKTPGVPCFTLPLPHQVWGDPGG